jgi:hypothetical protein
MKELTQADTTPQKDEALKSNKKKTLWQQPTLTFLGKVKDLVQGWGKVGSNIDSDPHHVGKSGLG